MSQREARVDEAVSEAEIEGYLRSHPDFFERHGELLLTLRLPHASSPATVSLVERQVAMLRKRSDQLERRLKSLVAVAKLNDSLVTKIHSLALKLVRARNTGAALECIETALREDFSAERAAVVLYADVPAARAAAGGFTTVYARDAEALKPFATFLRAGTTRCGPLRQRQKELLFGRDDEVLGSAAMVPLGKGAKLGFLVIGNKDAEHFNPAKSTDLLDRLGELIAVALERDDEEASASET
jgi:uncharacterized protein YigA (DUF484 family)